MKNIYILYLIILVFLAGCKPQIDEFEPSKGSADFTKYVAVGNSLTAGYADGALYKSGQEYSYPNILATQMKFVGGGNFVQPLMVDDLGVGFLGNTPVTKRILGFPTDCLGTTSMAPVLAAANINPANLDRINDQGPFNNLGIPGMKAIHIAVPGYATLNPYYFRFAGSMDGTVIDDIVQANATFFTCWLGSNDILGYALGGGEGDVITPTNLFEAAIQGGLDALMANGAKGAICNLPEILTIPYLNLIPYNPIVLTDQALVDQLNAGYAPLNQIIKGAGSDDTIAWALGQNPMVMVDAGLPWGLRQSKSTDKVLLSLPQDSLKCAGWGTQVPVAANLILDAFEQEAVSIAVTEYNNIIKDEAMGRGLAFVDFNAMFKIATEQGYVFDGVKYNGDFVTGNLFSLDGIHMTPAGAALTAYYFIEAINSTFGASLPQVIVPDYPAVTFPDENI